MCCMLTSLSLSLHFVSVASRTPTRPYNTSCLILNLLLLFSIDNTCCVVVSTHTHTQNPFADSNGLNVISWSAFYLDNPSLQDLHLR